MSELLSRLRGTVAMVRVQRGNQMANGNGNGKKKNGGKNGTPIGAILKAARMRLELTADQVAEACEVSRSRVYMWEASAYVFPKNFRRISAVLNIPIKKLRDANGPRPRRV